MLKKNKKRQIAKTSIFIMSIFVIFMSITYAFVTQVLIGEKGVVISAGVLDLVLEEENEITISDALPMYDEVGMIQEDMFEFRLVNKTSNPTNYVLKLSKINADNELSTSDVKYYLTKEGVGEPKLLSSLPVDGTVDSGTIAGSDTIDYTLRLWINSAVTDDAVLSGKTLSYRIDAEVSQELMAQELVTLTFIYRNLVPEPGEEIEDEKYEFKAPKGMKWEEFIVSEYANNINDYNYFDDDDAPDVRFMGVAFGNEYETYVDPLGDEYEQLIFVQLSDVIDENEIYVIEAGG